jgi:ribosomal protein L11 methyltransferase
LGAKEVWGIDIDGAAVENARVNVERNEVSDIVKIRKGGIGGLRKKFDVIVANIDLKSLRKMRIPLVGRLKDNGFLILSGVLEEEKERIRLHYLEAGRLRWIKTAQKREWVCLTFQRK